MSAEGEARAKAQRFRHKYHLGDQPLGDLVSLIEQTTGIDVAVLAVDNADEHGMTLSDPHRNVTFIAVATADNPMRQRSTLAHELGHALFEDNDDSDETRANAFARHLLIPVKGLKEFVGKRHVDEAMLSAVVQRFLVSPQIAVIAMCEAGCIDEMTKVMWNNFSTPRLAARFGWSDQYKALQAESCQPRAPQRLLARATNGYIENVVSVRTLANLRGCEISVVERDLNEAGIQPEGLEVAWSNAADLPTVDVDFTELDELDRTETG